VDSKVTSNFKKVFAKLKREVGATYSKKQMTMLGEFAADMIRIRTGLGYGVAWPGAKRSKLKELSEEYVEARKSFSELSGFTTPERSNLTRTGQMLESIIVLNATSSEVEVGPQGERYDTDIDTSNDKIAKYVAEQGRPFISVSDLEIKKLVRHFKKEIIGKVFKR
jgi:hypothetical protein